MISIYGWKQIIDTIHLIENNSVARIWGYYHYSNIFADLTVCCYRTIQNFAFSFHPFILTLFSFSSSPNF